MSSNIELFARLERKGKHLCSEPLDIHLACVGVVSGLLAERLYTPSQSEHLGSYDMISIVTAAGALHDIGKTLFNVVRRRLIDAILRGEREVTPALTFPGHEVLSTALAGYALWESGYESEAITAIVRPILLHHQGLRGVSVEWLEQSWGRISRNLASMDRVEEFVRLLRSLLDRVSRRLRAWDTKAAASIVRDIGEFYYDAFSVSLALERARNLVATWVSPRTVAGARIRESIRVATGIVMAADNIVASSASQGCSSHSLYVRELARLAEAAGISGEILPGCRLDPRKILPPEQKFDFP